MTYTFSETVYDHHINCWKTNILGNDGYIGFITGLTKSSSRLNTIKYSMLLAIAESEQIMIEADENV